MRNLLLNMNKTTISNIFINVKTLFIMMFMVGLLMQPAVAKTIPVEAMSDFSTENPPHSYSVKILQDLSLDDKVILMCGDIVEGKIIDVTDPKRLKRNAVFSFVPLVKTDAQGKSVEITGYFPAKYTTVLNKGNLAKNAALCVGNYFVKGLSLGYNAVEGAVKNEEGNRLKSSANAVYESTPFSYAEKGSELFIEKGQTFYLNFKVKNDDIYSEE